MSADTEALKTARGKQYYDILRRVLAECGEQMAQDARRIKDDTGKITLLDCGALALRYDLNLKATMEWLEEAHVLYVGTYETCKDRGMKATEVLAAAALAMVEAE